MKVFARIVLLAFSLALLNGCESIVSRHLVVSAESVPNPDEVEAVFDSFAAKHEFTCKTGRTSPLLKECRANGPRFLWIERKDTLFVIQLDQPFPGAQWQPPKKFTETADELVQLFRAQFGGSVEVITTN